MIKNAKYIHTNLIAEDWRKLAGFYIDILGCKKVPPERDLKGKEIENGTGIKDAVLKGIHLRLPGWEQEGPTLELFTYSPQESTHAKKVNRPGYGHIAFQVENIRQAREEILSAGGTAIGDVVTVSLPNGMKITWCYVTDPEGNIIELQMK